MKGTFALAERPIRVFFERGLTHTCVARTGAIRLASLLTLSVLTSATASGQSVIPGWTVSPKVFLNREIKYSGTASACVRLSQTASTNESALTQEFKADDFRGKRIQISMYAYAQNFIAGYFLLGINTVGPEGQSQLCWLHPIESTDGKWMEEPWKDNKGGWGQCDVPSNSERLQVYVEVKTGPTRVPFICVDDIDVKVIGPAKEDSSKNPAQAGSPRTIANPLKNANFDE
ncbi:hypothetical protein [Paraburkholderia dilworthii]|uniref:hypothetical protein n=1 Tax=Paraburkholderia dilworthii TaxID=948106 RepID=UPI001268306B|nr:hypothetical protein [Paraburkholderia dilworthii]